MKIPTLNKILAFLLLNVLFLSTAQASNEYTLIIEGYDWGPNVSKVIVPLDSSTTGLDFRDFSVWAERSTDCMEIPAPQKSGARHKRNDLCKCYEKALKTLIFKAFRAFLLRGLKTKVYSCVGKATELEKILPPQNFFLPLT